VAQRHKSAIKRHRQSVKLAERNRVIRTRVRHSMRTLREAIGNKDTANAESELRSTIRTLDKAVTQGVLHRNNAARRIARLSRQVAELKA
jgi:small subunit ribosomal protein S20